jgi:hypothetical protein
MSEAVFVPCLRCNKINQNQKFDDRLQTGQSFVIGQEGFHARMN